MKKKLIATTMAFALTLSIDGCGSTQEQETDSVEFEQTEQTETSEDTSDEIEVISEQEALLSALDQAGLTEADVTVTQVELDMDDGKQIYEIEFATADMEYEYEVNATTGSVLSFSQDVITGDDDD